MNCKQGDLAIVVAAVNPENLGKIVCCISFIPQDALLRENLTAGHPGWITDIPLKTSLIGYPERKITLNFAQDSALRPLRGTPGEDETLSWAGKPRHVVDTGNIKLYFPPLKPAGD